MSYLFENEGNQNRKKKPQRRAKKSDLSSGKNKGRTPTSSEAKAFRRQELKIENVVKEEQLKISKHANSSRMQSLRGEFDDPILHLYMVLLISALLYACVRYFLGEVKSL